MLTVDFNPFPVLETERLTLRAIRETDAGEMFGMRSDERVMRFVGRPLAERVEDAAALIAVMIDWQSKRDAVTWALTLSGDDRLIGTIGFWRMQKENYRAEIGYMLGADFHGRGLMSEALAAVLSYGFDVMKLHSVEANVNPENAASIRILEKNGFVREAYFKENYFFDGRFSDSAIYSLLAPDK